VFELIPGQLVVLVDNYNTDMNRQGWTVCGGEVRTYLRSRFSSATIFPYGIEDADADE
jgi:hypothetical protein